LETFISASYTSFGDTNVAYIFAIASFLTHSLSTGFAQIYTLVIHLFIHIEPAAAESLTKISLASSFTHSLG